MINTFFDSQFGYCLSIWMFHGRMTNNKMNKRHESAYK